MQPDNEIWYTTTDGVSLDMGKAYNTVKGDYFVAGYNSSVTTISGSMFINKATLKDIILPLSVTSILTSAFWGCSGLKSVMGLDNVTLLSNKSSPWHGPFEGLGQGVNLNNGQFPKLLSCDNDLIFRGSKFTTGLSFPQYIGHIPIIFPHVTCDYIDFPLAKTMSNHSGSTQQKGVFGYSSIPTIKLQSIETIGSEAFTHSSLRDLYLGNVVPVYTGTIFSGVPNIHIPSASLNDYLNNEQWGQYASKFVTY